MHRTTAVLLMLLGCISSPLAPERTSAATIETEPVGYLNNAPDSNGLGSVGYSYRIGKYEVTNSQYAEFLNAKAVADPLGLYNTGMDSQANGGITRSGSSGSYTYAAKPNMGDKPVMHTSWYDAVRFVNWLDNGQGTGDTETGAYTLQGGTPVPSNFASIGREPNATWFLPTANEWYKAAYYELGGDSDNYWLYPTRSNNTPYSDQPPGSGAPAPSNTANFFANDSIPNGYNDGYAATGSTIIFGSQVYLTDVGAYTLSVGPFGTFDQGGNASEWSERFHVDGAVRYLQGGVWSGSAVSMAASPGAITSASTEGHGFRVAVIPEPSALAMAVIGLGGLALNRLLRKRRCRAWRF